MSFILLAQQREQASVIRGFHHWRAIITELAMAAASSDLRGGLGYATEKAKLETCLAKREEKFMFILSLAYCISVNLGMIFALHTL